MTGKRAINVIEISAYINFRFSLDIKALDIHRAVCDIYGSGQMSHKSVGRLIVKFPKPKFHLSEK
jgi:hypothetical protein